MTVTVCFASAIPVVPLYPASCFLVLVFRAFPGTLVPCSGATSMFCDINASSCVSTSSLSSQCMQSRFYRSFNMPTVLSFDPKKSALVIALVLVPLAILCSILALALACSEYWSSRAPGSRFPCFRRDCSSRRRRDRQRSHPGPPSSCTIAIPEVSTSPSEYCSPVTAREEV